jgi:predicted metal-dependent hydrolase
MTFDWTHGPLAEGLRHYDAGNFFAAHEAWESVWLHAPQPEKTFLQALIQVAVAFHHLQRSNPLGATRLLTAALRKLDLYPPDFTTLGVALLRDDIRANLDVLSTTPLNKMPTIQLPTPRIHPL